ncbi:YggS family pyridoxal phosphate-dependent enzyme [Aeromicrobium terrae]|uniref:Pyridoxal phosphate homeostasis protein n=1 Tax=Aeromicrobium terrae TaxID=2498846 RepID=A0A5C8NLW7_9ACTN|nr:YggS family pyridoxal phosphate-dependent enzyme [Aeromicrobium terrae]TXL62844.1 YggS family pyridoxal phosphate-dependent enzyme [Aeromicrobium terrae]
MTRRDELAANLAAVEERIASACADAGRQRDEITLIVVTKTYPHSDAELLRDLGVTDIGENRHPEAESKVTDGLRLHFVGGLQTNKAGAVTRYADVVQSVDRPKLARSLSRGAEAAGREVECLVQVDFQEGADAGRAGVAPDGILALADEIASLGALTLRGLMTVAPLGADPRPVFDRLMELSADLRRQHPGATVVSAGMSDDFEHAVAAGATHLRVGRSVLGERPPAR